MENGFNAYVQRRQNHWEMVYVTADVQKQYDEANKENEYQEAMEMKADNTYTSTASAGGKQRFNPAFIPCQARHWK